jgi:hypothetical protein
VDRTPAPDTPDRLIAAATEVLRQHGPDAEGWCRGCLSLWGRLVTFEQCTQAEWVAAVHTAYQDGSHDDRPAPTID